MNFLLRVLGLIDSWLKGWEDDYLHRNDPIMTTDAPVSPKSAPGQAETPIVPPTAPNRFSIKVVSWAHLVALEEGAKPELNNPGNLKFSTLTKSWGGEKGFEAADGGWICRFPTYEIGFDALCNFLTLGCEDELISYHSPEARTFGGFTKIYAGNPPQGYINAIAKGLGCSLDTPIRTFL